ncbi:sigma-70 family RNA polymerase sigma factor [Adhaeretor mobilis]|uniref:RNA polymerase sigma factor n=1 Tax=Adhaeretor mobilis TaxID=1930276 RepID=A0A517N189_9BACT|nr:sigma-70 family RNA polymerase sigma factor [Adhaeretor mobilis]QDT00899.1 RNA polymerase sigma factor [Adhaeretor mobilis]
MSGKSTDSQFVDILSSNQARMRAYAISMVGNPSDADDLLQNACLTLWEKRDNYDADREFFPWACGFVLIEILRHRRKKATDKLMFDDALVKSLSAEYEKYSYEYDIRREQLHLCLGRLNAKDRNLLNDRYCQNAEPKNISQRRGLPLPTVYGSLSRIRRLLHRCIETQLAQRS